MNEILIPILILAALGLFFALILSFVNKKLAVPVDERAAKIEEALPGANCGGCGFASCSAYASSLADGSAKMGQCRVAGADAYAVISQALGVEAPENAVPMKAFVACKGCISGEEDKLRYSGVESCKAVTAFFGGKLKCTYGCTGYGDCVSACTQNAISIVDGIAKVDPELCSGCLVCVSVCPKGVIIPVHAESSVAVACNSHTKGSVTRANCSAGCIGCKKCEKVCETGAVAVSGHLAKVDPDRCTHCGKCVEACPVGCIQFVC
ncbi:MAG: 4Fe-4S dicluster domain-containing protein [Ruminococcaceae bacterium]|nr:4Fe-4S dicluster domain-containing protein [Oscillospiraceae bacterium]